MQTHSTIFTLGHSRLSWEAFHKLLDANDIGAVIDVRSSPTSRWAQFRRPALQSALNRVGISYVFSGDQLGGRLTVSYAEVATTDPFRQGVDGVLAISARCRVAMMCSEAEPLACHRCLLIGRHFAERGVPVVNILASGQSETQTETEDRLLALTRTRGPDLLDDRDTRLRLAYRKQEVRIRGKEVVGPIEASIGGDRRAINCTGSVIGSTRKRSRI